MHRILIKIKKKQVPTSSVYRKNDGVFWGPRGKYIFFYKNIFNLKGNCVLRTLKNSFGIF
jgi:hypothetical protein